MGKAGAVLAAVAAVVLVLWMRTSTQPGILHETQGESQATTQVTVMDVTGQSWEGLPQKLAEGKVPVLVRGSVASAWPALRTWTPEHIARSTRRMPKVFKQADPYFRHFAKHRPMESLLQVYPTFDVVNMTGPTFFASLMAKPSLYYYWAGPVSMLGAAAADVEPYQSLILNPDENYFNAWISSQGVIASCHYDMYHNFFVQIRGRKRFTLFPPADWHNLHVFPISHPNHRQCQVDLLRRQEDPDLKKAHAITMDVGPGDLLYLPPFWFHHVEALDLSMSVNVWSYTPDFSNAHGIFRLPVPFEEDWHDQLKHSALFAYILELLTQCDMLNAASILASTTPPDTPISSTFLNDMVHARFLTLPPEQLAVFTRSPTKNDAGAAYVCVAPWQDSAVATMVGDESAVATLRNKFTSRATETCSRLNGIPLAERSILLEDFIEELIEYFVGTSNILAFLDSCFLETDGSKLG